jgi:nitrate reductase delta subunit
MLTFRVLAALLNYPTPDLKSEAGDAANVLRSERLLTGSHLDKVCDFLARLEALPQLESESLYIETFDRGRSTSLHLFEHIHGESRDRGQAMVRLIMRYRMHGLELSSGELPDFLPLFLEFLSTCRPGDANKYLSEVADIVALIGQRLHKRESPYAVVLDAVASLALQETHGESPAVNADGDGRDDTPAALDAAWEEAPVTFDDASLSATERTLRAAIQGRRAITPGA